MTPQALLHLADAVQLLQRLRARGHTWLEAAAHLNFHHLRLLGRFGPSGPWTADTARQLLCRQTKEPGRQAIRRAWLELQRASRARRAQLRGLVCQMYLEERQHPDRVQRVLERLEVDGLAFLPAGQRISRQWVSQVVARANLRAVATRATGRRARPRLRADCLVSPRPCPWTACRHHLVPHLLASAERSYRNPANRSVPQELAAPLEAGDFRSLEHTCLLDVLDARGCTDDQAGLVDAIADGSAIGRTLGITRELVRLDTRKAIGKVRLLDPLVADFLQRGYDVSKLGGDR